MCRPRGITKAGRQSAHTLDNTGPRRFLVTEFDYGTQDEQAGLLQHLAEFAPLVCVLFSGGKSLHGWFYFAGQSEQRTRRFFEYAVALGADPAMWVRSQFARMPEGRRASGARQTCYYFAPDLVNDSTR